jgi:lipoprotein-releasing system permease protein
MVEGARMNIPDTVTSNEAVISRHYCIYAEAQVGDDFAMYFVQDPPRARRFTVSGIYETGLEELDKIFVIADIRHIQRLNDWDEDQVSGFEILLDDYDNLERVTSRLMSLQVIFLPKICHGCGVLALATNIPSSLTGLSCWT